MSEHRSLYEITGNIGDYNTILINRAELQELQKYTDLSSVYDDMIEQLKACVQMMSSTDSCWNVDEDLIDDDWVEVQQDSVHPPKELGGNDDVGVDQFSR